jgi:hypothetical protein
MTTKRRPLGNPLPATKDVTITQSDIDIAIAQWDSVVPEKWRGLLDAKPLDWTGKQKPRFYFDEVRRVTIRASNGKVVTAKEKRLAYLAYQDALK